MDAAERHRDELCLAPGTPERILLGVSLGLVLALPGFVSDAWLVRATIVWLYAIGVLGQNLLLGFAGQFSFGQAGFLAVGAYGFAHLRQAGAPFPAALLLAGLTSAAAGVILGFPALRLKGPHLAIATLGFGIVVYQALAASEGLSGGRSGLLVPPLAFPGGVRRSVGLYYLSLGLLLVFVAAAFNLVSGFVGRAWVAIRDADVAAQAMGVSLTRYKLLAFAVSSFYTGVHGALFAQFLGHLEPQSFTVAESVSMIVAVMVGGAASVAGAILGAAFVTLLPALSGGAVWFVPVALGLALIVVMRFEPEGLAGRLRRIRLGFETGQPPR